MEVVDLTDLVYLWGEQDADGGQALLIQVTLVRIAAQEYAIPTQQGPEQDVFINMYTEVGLPPTSVSSQK